MTGSRRLHNHCRENPNLWRPVHHRIQCKKYYSTIKTARFALSLLLLPHHHHTPRQHQSPWLLWRKQQRVSWRQLLLFAQLLLHERPLAADPIKAQRRHHHPVQHRQRNPPRLRFHPPICFQLHPWRLRGGPQCRLGQ
jgi:hypothetical protein